MGSDNYFISISLKALEVNITDLKRMQAIKKFLTIVVKRGKQQREETDPRLNYTPLSKDNETDTKINKSVYSQIMREYGLEKKGGRTRLESDDSDDATRSSSLSISTISKTTPRASSARFSIFKKPNKSVQGQ
jgi:hypothetical protein